jgi:hypothetical protein
MRPAARFGVLVVQCRVVDRIDTAVARGDAPS